jgi:hypothetical protein
MLVGVVLNLILKKPDDALPDIKFDGSI